MAVSEAGHERLHDGSTRLQVVAVTRRGSTEKLPGETRILRSFCDACALHRKRLAGADQVRLMPRVLWADLTCCPWIGSLDPGQRHCSCSSR